MKALLALAVLAAFPVFAETADSKTVAGYAGTAVNLAFWYQRVHQALGTSGAIVKSARASDPAWIAFRKAHLALIEIQKRLLHHSATSPVTQEQWMPLLKRVKSRWTDEILGDLIRQLENFENINNFPYVLIQLQRGIFITGLGPANWADQIRMHTFQRLEDAIEHSHPSVRERVKEEVALFYDALEEKSQFWATWHVKNVEALQYEGTRAYVSGVMADSLTKPPVPRAIPEVDTGIGEIPTAEPASH